MTNHEVLVNRKIHRVRILESNESTFLVEVNEKTVKVKMKNPNQGKIAIMEIDGRSFKASIVKNQRNVLKVKIGGKVFEIQHQPKIPKETAARLGPPTITRRIPTASLAIGKDAVIAPIAGRIVLWKASVGQRVEKGECVCILEAMKMENEIATPRGGVVKEIKALEGAIVTEGQVLAVVA